MSSDLSGFTKLFTTDPEEMIALKRRVLGDVLPPKGRADAIYCVGGTTDTQEQDLEIGSMLWHAGHAKSIGVLRGTTTYGYCGFEFCCDRLMRRGRVPAAAIIPVDILPEDEDRVNTRTEGKALLVHAGTYRWRTVIVCAPFFHQIRASSTFVSLLNQQDPELWIFNQPGEPGKIQQRVRHSQGVVEGDLLDLFISEFGRLFLYHNFGHICSCAELIAYYDRRDQQHALHMYT